MFKKKQESEETNIKQKKVIKKKDILYLDLHIPSNTHRKLYTKMYMFQCKIFLCND